jgi:hypothetical protein
MKERYALQREGKRGSPIICNLVVADHLIQKGELSDNEGRNVGKHIKNRVLPPFSAQLAFLQTTLNVNSVARSPNKWEESVVEKFKTSYFYYHTQHYIAPHHDF